MTIKSVFYPALLTLIVCCTSQPNLEAAEFNLLPAVSESDIPEDIERDSWARLPAVTRDSLDADGQRVFDLVTSQGNGYDTGLRGPVGMFMYSPELAEGVWQLRQRVRYGTVKDQRLTELVIISTAREINNQYEYSAHEPLAQTAGLEPGIIDFVKYRRPIEEAGTISGMGELEKTLIQFTREVISEPKVTQVTFSTAIELLGEQGVMDLTGLIGYYSFVAMTLKAFDVQRQPDSELLLPVRVTQ